MNKWCFNLLARVPFAEVLLRHLYWSCPCFWKKLSLRRSEEHLSVSEAPPFDFDEILNFINEKTPLKGRLVILHSSYEALMPSRLHYREILKKVEDAIGEEGTLAMPVIRRYRELENLLPFSPKISKIKCVYDVHNTDVLSGALPYYMLLRDKRAVVSRFPLNPLIARGPLAAPMMEHNLEGAFPTPHGPNSAWKFCVDHNALVIGLGIRLTHHFTLAHVAEDIFPWPVSRKNWYRERMFTVINGEFKKDVTVYERKPKWGMCYLPESREEYDYIRAGVVKVFEKNGLTISLAESGSLMNYLKSRSTEGYPYWIPWYLKH